MSPLFLCTVERRDFGLLVAGHREKLRPIPDIAAVGRAGPPREQQVHAVWSADPSITDELPEMLITSDGMLSDWAAWLTTFGAKFRPFSAHMRLVTHGALRALASAAEVPTLGRLMWPAVGMILGELQAVFRMRDGVVDNLPTLASASTLAFAIFRAAALYPEFADWDELIDLWRMAQSVNGPRRGVQPDATAKVCKSVVSAISSPVVISGSGDIEPEVRFAVRDLVDGHGEAPRTFFSIPGFAEMEQQMRGSREDRVLAFEKFLALRRQFGGSEVFPMSVGYAASRVAPGTLRHTALLAPVLDQFPTALLWYGFCAGFRKMNTTDPEERPGGIDFPPSARRIARDLLRREAVVGRPYTDISFLEFQTLAKTGSPLGQGVVTTVQGSMTVELIPCVWTAVSTPSTAPTREAPEHAPAEDPGRYSRDRVILNAMGEYIDRLQDAYAALTAPQEPEGRQGTLGFPKRRPRK